MNRIIIMQDSQVLREVTLTHGTLRIGRARDNDICIDDPTISHHHAKIVTIFNASHIEDLNSTNGTLVENRRIQEHTLHDGDVVILGRHVLRFLAENSRHAKNRESAGPV